MKDNFSTLKTHTGLEIQVRPIGSGDNATLSRFFDGVTTEDLRFRFLSSLKAVGEAQIKTMTEVDHERTETFLAFEGMDETPVGVAMLACDQFLETGEVAVSVRADRKNRGIGWELLRHVTDHANKKGIKVLQSIENRANAPAIQLEREMGFEATPYEGDSTLVILRKQLA